MKTDKRYPLVFHTERRANYCLKRIKTEKQKKIKKALDKRELLC